MDKSLFLAVISFILHGCVTYGVVKNTPITRLDTENSYSVTASKGLQPIDDTELIIAFSGGGGRAAALSYGVMSALRDTGLNINSQQKNMLDEIDRISAVSGGSFTAAYYGLYGDRIFDDYIDNFLHRDIQKDLLLNMLNPLNWFRSSGRTELAIEYFNETLFHGATYQDMIQEDKPLIIINSSDLGYGIRFSYLQEYFNLICSDLTTFNVARAVASSSAVPVLFNPVVMENFASCGAEKPDWLKNAEKKHANDPHMAMLTNGLNTYLDKQNRKYVHFVDGGITDNLGLRVIFDTTELLGGIKNYFKLSKSSIPRRIAVISVNASTTSEPEMDLSNRQPNLEQSINAMTDVQLHRYNLVTLTMMQETLKKWAQQLSTPDHPVEPYFIQIKFTDIKQKQERSFFNRIPTSFSLSNQQVDKLVEVGKKLIIENPEYQRLVNDIKRQFGDHDTH